MNIKIEAIKEKSLLTLNGVSFKMSDVDLIKLRKILNDKLNPKRTGCFRDTETIKSVIIGDIIEYRIYKTK